jgi:hypothetical protein
MGGLPCLTPAEYSVICPDGVIRPIAPPTSSANHMLPSGPDAIPAGAL